MMDKSRMSNKHTSEKHLNVKDLLKAKRSAFVKRKKSSKDCIGEEFKLEKQDSSIKKT